MGKWFIHVPQQKTLFSRHASSKTCLNNQLLFLFKIYLFIYSKKFGGVSSLTIWGSDKRGRTNQGPGLTPVTPTRPLLFFLILFLNFCFLFCLFVIIIFGTFSKWEVKIWRGPCSGQMRWRLFGKWTPSFWFLRLPCGGYSMEVSRDGNNEVCGVGMALCKEP